MKINIPIVVPDDFFDKFIEKLKKEDLVYVVRCKDCKYFNKAGCSIEIVDDSDRPQEDDYCSFGERKQNNE